ncbi:uncharacterized protein [Dermacentor albipictus]|uniref:uncharacterized protein isoform X1 n=1 Tax=Dermacentor albipictus TaxID=60249 RepID=UPI0038FC9EBB
MAHRLPEFEDEKDKWQAYLVKVEAYFEANDVKDDAKQRALLVAALGTRTIEILNGKVAPRKPNALTYKEVVQTLNSYYDPVPNAISESFKFFHRCQQEGESVHAFIVAIRQMAHNCNFGTMLDRMMRDRIVCGVRSKNVQKQLLAKKDLNLEEAEALALAAESAERDSQGIVRDQEQARLLKLSGQYESRAKSQGVQQCKCCGRRGHKTNACRLIKRKCYKCARPGHLARMCAANEPSKLLAVTAQATESEESDSSASQIWSLTTTRSLIPPIRKSFAWNGIEIMMDIDTGSPVRVIPKSIYKLHSHRWPQLQKAEVQLSCYLGKLPLLGALTMPVYYDGTTVQCSLTVLDCNGPSLCGRDLLKKLTDERIQVLSVYSTAPVPKQALEDVPMLLQQHSDLFTEGAGLMKGPPARLHIKAGANPKFFKESGDDFWQGLLAYRSAPLEDGRSPGELLQGRRLRANLPDFHEVPCTEVKKHCQHAQGKPLPKLSRGDVVRLRGTRTWSRKARVRGTQAPRSYQLVTEDGQVLRRNRKHLIRTDEPYDETSSEDGDDTTETSTPVDNPQVPAMHSSAGSTSQASESSRTTAGAQQCPANTEGRPTPDSVLTPAPRRSSRNTRPPQRLRYDEAFNQIA